MKIKVDLAAFEALTQEQIEALASAQHGAKAQGVTSTMLTHTACIGWGPRGDRQELNVYEDTISVLSDYGYYEVRWATIEKLAEYNVITFQP